MSIRIAYLNGHFIDAEQAKLPVHDAGFVWGAAVVERVRTYGRKYFRLAEHLSRFRQSCDLCRVPQPVPDAELVLFADHLLAENGPVTHPEAEFELLIFATPGVDAPNLGMFAEPLNLVRFGPLLDRGARLVIPPTRHLPSDCVPPQAKMRSRMHWWIAEQQAKEIDSEASALILDQDGHVTETAMANVLVVQNGTVQSPSRASILNGITLQVIEELCAELGVPFREAPLSVADCETADEILLTSSPFGVVGVSSLNMRPVAWPGPMLQRLHAAFSRLVGMDIWRGLGR